METKRPPILFSRPALSDDLVNASRMARLLRVQVRWLKAEAAAGRIPCVPTDVSYLFNPPAVEAVLIERAKKFPGEAADA